MTSTNGWGSRHRKPGLVLAALLLSMTAASGVPAAEHLDSVLGKAEVAYPDLVPNVTYVGVWQTMVFEPETETWSPGPYQLFFDTWSQNLGTVPVELTADDPGNPSTTVSQCVAWTVDRLCREQRQVGGFTWHDEHTHFHYEDFAGYELRTFRSNGRVDWSSGGLVAASEKVSFCLMDSAQADPNALPAPYYASCTPARQGISSGWADIYDSGLPGQSFSIPDLADGRYALVVTLDGANRLYETDDTNNRVVVTLDVSASTETVSVVDRSWPRVRTSR